MKPAIHRSGILCALALLLLCTGADAAEGISASLLNLTGDKRVKIVFSRDTTAGGRNFFGEANVFKMYVYDTADDEIREIKSSLDDYSKPLITHDGQRIVYSDRVEHKVRVINWDGSGQRDLVNGFAGSLWYDEASDKEWVYYQENGNGDNSSNPIKRLDIDNTGDKLLVWNQTETNALWMSISGDGARIASSWPWSKCGAIEPGYGGGGGGGIYYPDTGYYTTGCWTTILPDSSYKLGVFDGPHRAWKVWDWPTGSMRTLDLHSAPGIDGWEIYHPRLSNHRRHLVMTGPYSVGSMGANNIGNGGPQVEVYFGKLDAGFTRVTDWIKVTSNSRADFWPDAWVDPAVPNNVRIDSFTATPDAIRTGESATLAWATTNATSVSIAPGIGGVAGDGSQQVSPAANTTYTLTAEGQGGPVTRQVTITVESPQLDELRVTPATSTIEIGQALGFSAEAYDQFGDPIAVVIDWTVSSGGSMSPSSSGVAVTQHGSTFTSDGSTGTFTISAASGGVTGTAAVTVWDPSALHMRINCGDGTPHVDGWADEDPYRTGGNTYDFHDPTDFNGQPDPAPSDVYQTCIHLDHSYSILVPAGEYIVRIHFFDNVGGTGRAMDYTIEGTKVLDDFSIVAAAGGGGKVLIREFNVTVDGDGLQIVAEKDQGNDAFETGIEVIARSTSDTEDPRIAITAPAEGTTVTGDVLIEGTASDNASVSKVEVQIDDGPFELASGTLSWSFTLFSDTLVDGEHTISARATDPSDNTAQTSITINADNAPSLAIISPVGGEQWNAGTTQLIRWTTRNMDNVSIFYSLDGGMTYHELVQTVFDGDPDWENYPWVVPNASTDEARILIQGYFGEVPTESNLFSIIGSGGGIEITSPSGGETLTGGETSQIRWIAEDAESALLEFSSDDGGNWTRVASVGATDAGWGDYSWSVPNIASEYCRLRGTTPAGASDTTEPFAIVPGTVEAGELEVTHFSFTATVPGLPGGMSEVSVAGQSFPVDAEGRVSVEVAVPEGVASIVYAMSGTDGEEEYERLIKIELEDAEPPIEGLAVSAAALRSFVGDRNGVLVWVDAGGRISALDFREAEPEVRIISSDIDSLNPLVSPDGTRVVYSQGMPNGPKRIFLRSLSGGPAQQIATGDVGYWHIPGAGEEAIVYCDWSSRQDNGAGGMTYKQALVPGEITADGLPETLVGRAMDAGPNAHLTWLGHVYNNLWAYDLRTGTEYSYEQFFLFDDAVADHQTCNGSMAPDGSARMMSLVIPHIYVRIFGHDAGADVFRETSRFEPPPGMEEWEFPEWSTHPDFATAALHPGDLNLRLFVLKVADGTVVPEMLQITGEDASVTYSHLYLEP